MRFYNNSHPYYCGIDLHARLLFVSIIDSKGEVIAHKKIGTSNLSSHEDGHTTEIYYSCR